MESIREMQVAAVAAAEEKRRAFQGKRDGGRGKREERRREGKEEEEALFVPPPTTTTATPPANQAYFSIVPSHLTTSHPWFHPSPTSSLFHSLPSAHQAGIWTYPSTPLERARCATFRKVWTQGMFMGQGVKFGGEFLVYPGTSLPLSSPSLVTDASQVIR
jgi:tRNA-splicing endonuclease subunit Sen34